MPNKFNASRRHKFEKRRCRITNWSAYNESLRQRGDVTVWLSPEMAAAWRAERRNVRGGQPVYSDLAITVCLTLGMVYKQPLRQTEGFVRSLVRLMGQAHGSGYPRARLLYLFTSWRGADLADEIAR
jgi:hypothetical protein